MLLGRRHREQQIIKLLSKLTSSQVGDVQKMILAMLRRPHQDTLELQKIGDEWIAKGLK